MRILLLILAISVLCAEDKNTVPTVPDSIQKEVYQATTMVLRLQAELQTAREKQNEALTKAGRVCGEGYQVGENDKGVTCVPISKKEVK